MPISTDASPRIALLTDGKSEHAWHLVQQLKEMANGSVFVASTVVADRSDPTIPTISSANPAVGIPKKLLASLFRSVVLKHPKAPRNRDQTPEFDYAGALDSKSLVEALATFKPAVLLISGIGAVPADVLNTAPIRLKAHTGFLPYYRGPDAIERTVAQKNYQYLGVTIHSVTEQSGVGAVWKFVPVIPYPLEPHALFRNRIMARANEALVETSLTAAISNVDETDEIDSTRLSEKISGTTQDLVEQIGSSRSVNDLSRFSLLNGGVDYSGNRIVKIFIRSKLRRRSLANGWYILNYHDICADSEFEDPPLKVPSIFTEQSVFEQHLDYWQDNFKAISIYEGIELLKRNEQQSNRFLTITFDDGLKSSASKISSVNSSGFRPALFISGDPLAGARPLANHANLIAARLASRLNKPAQEIRNSLLSMASGQSVEPDLANSIMAEYVTQNDFETNLVPGDFDIGAHSMTHARPVGSIDPQQASEVGKSLAIVSQATNRKVDLFAHPYGKIADRSIDTDWAAEQQSAYHFACSGGINSLQNPSGALNRIAIHNESVDEVNDLMLMQWGA